MKPIRRQKDSTPAENHPEPVNGATIPLAQALADHLNGNIEGALAKLNSIDGEDGNIADVVAAKAHLLLRANRFEEAQRQFARLISIKPSLEAAHYHSGFCLYQLGEYEAAVGAFEESRKLAPGGADTQIALGNCLLNLNRPGDAVSTFEKCLAEHPENESAMVGKAVALQSVGDIEAASRVSGQLLERSSPSAECLANLTLLGLQNSNFDLVRAAADRLLKLDPNSEIALQGLGATGLAVEEFKVAAQYYEKLVELHPTNYDYWLNLGVARHRVGNHDGAAESEDFMTFSGEGTVLFRAPREA